MEEKNPPVVDGLENKENNETKPEGENKVEGTPENKVAENGEENKENAVDKKPEEDDDDDDFIKTLLKADDEEEEENRQKNRDAEAARKRREAEAKAKAEQEAKAKQEAEAKAKQEAEAKAKQEAEAKAQGAEETPQKQLGKQLVDFHEKYPDIDLKQLDEDVAFKKFIDGKILGKKDFTALYEDYLEIKSSISGKAVEEVSRNYNKQKASSGSSKSASNLEAGSVFTPKELEDISSRLPFMSEKQVSAIWDKYSKSVNYHSKK